MTFEPGVLAGENFLGLSDLEVRSRRAAGGLASLGVTPGQSVALLLRNDHAFFEAAWAATLLGAVVVPINWHGTPNEILYVLEDAGARVLVGHSDLLAPLRAELPRALQTLTVPTPPRILDAFRVDPEAAEPLVGDLIWDDWIGAMAPLGGRLPISPSSMIYTSGTTGRPKGVRQMPAPGDAGANSLPAVSTLAALGIAAEMRTVMTAPMYHAAPHKYAMIAARLGGFIVLQDRFDAEELLVLVERHEITHLYLVPTMFVRMLRLDDAVRVKYDTSSLCHVVHASAPCPPDIKRAMIDWLGPIVHEYYGCTESGAVVACDSDQWLAHPGTVGSAIEGATIRVYDALGRQLGPGGVGEIYVRRSISTDFEYHGLPGARSAVELDGLITCGDVGYLDADGYLYICDRARDMVISGGVNVYPAEIEAHLLTMPGVADCAVFGIPDEEFGESLAAVIEVGTAAAITDLDVREYLRSRLPTFKIPKTVEFRDHLPRQPSGKLLKRELRAPYWEAAGRLI